MKKKFLIITILALTMSLCACGEKKPDNKDSQISESVDNSNNYESSETIDNSETESTPGDRGDGPSTITSESESTEAPTESSTIAEMPTETPTPTEEPTPTPIDEITLETRNYLKNLEEELKDISLRCLESDYIGYLKIENDDDFFTYVPSKKSWEFSNVQYKLGDMFLSTTLALQPYDDFKGTHFEYNYKGESDFIHYITGDITAIYVDGEKVEDTTSMFVGQTHDTNINISTKNLNVGQKIQFNLKIPYDTKSVVVEYTCNWKTYDEFKNEKVFENVKMTIELFDVEVRHSHLSGDDNETIDELHWDAYYESNVLNKNFLETPDNPITISFDAKDGNNTFSFNLNSVNKITLKDFLMNSDYTFDKIEYAIREGSGIYDSWNKFWKPYKEMLGDTINDMEYSYFEDIPEELENVSIYKLNIGVKFDEFNFTDKSNYDILVASAFKRTSSFNTTEYEQYSYPYHHSSTFSYTNKYYARPVAFLMENFAIGSDPEKWQKEDDFNIYLLVDNTVELRDESILFRIYYTYPDTNNKQQTYHTIRGFVIKDVLEGNMPQP